MRKIVYILSDKRGESTSVSTGMKLIISIVLAGLVMTLFTFLLGNIISPGLQNAFANTENYTIIEPTTDGTTLPHS